VNWNTGAHLRNCLVSIQRTRRDQVILDQVVVFDNGSSDDSLHGVEHLGIPLKLIKSEVNLGFARACNRAAAATSSDYVLFLNPDTELLVDTLEVPILFMERPDTASVGICGLQLINAQGLPTLSFSKFPNLRFFLLQAIGGQRFSNRFTNMNVPPLTEGYRAVDQVIGAFFLVRRQLLEELGGFDERFFVYYEEVDFAVRAHQRGWSSACVSGATCVHIGGISSRQVKPARLFYSLRSRLLFGFKHYPLSAAIALVVLTLSLEFVARSVSAIARGSLGECKHVLKGYQMLVVDLARILRVGSAMRRG
jgi:GT2 family glycosyltransferase